MEPQDINNLKRRFLTLNRERMMRIHDDLRPRQQDVLDILPLLFHSNHPAFPGYVSKSTPVGISDYSPSQQALDAGKRLVRSFEHKRRALLQFDIYSIFLMGSSGTIAYSSNSDFDVWLCHRPDLDTVQLAELQQKAFLIEQWAASMDLEVHFFLMNADTFKRGEDVALSVESSGSAQHHLLLEEFYRTGLLLAGRYPVWWLVPPEEESDYEDYVERLKRQRLIKENETIDFGGLPRAPAEEFFGAALWQLYKGIDSPYKAALKLMLMEVYADEYPQVDLLSQRFKKAIHEGETKLARLDPYIMLYQKLEEYLLGKDEDRSRLDLVRRCFYFKVNEKLSTAPPGRQENWRYETMFEFAREWRWSDDYIESLDTRASWKINRVMEERKSLVNLLTQSYHSLSDFARRQALSSSINQQDLTVLGRKLYAAFERKAGKIDIVNRGISDNVWESPLTLYQSGKEQNSGWALYRGMNNQPRRGQEPLKRTRTMMEMLTWSHLNRIVDERTAFILHASNDAISVQEIKALLKQLQQLFPGGNPAPSSMEDFSQAAKMRHSALFINVGIQPVTTSVKEGKLLTSNKVDAFSYGGICQNLVYSLDHVIENTWQEVMTFRYEGEEGIFECLSDYMKWSPPSQGEVPPPVSTYCFTANSRGTTISRRIEELFKDIITCFYQGQHALNARYVLMIEHKYYVLSLDNDRLTYQVAGNYKELLGLLENPQETFSPVRMDRYCRENNLLSAILSDSRPDTIQVYFHMDGNNADIYITDENGALYFQRKTQVTLSLLTNQYKLFLESVIRRKSNSVAQQSSGMEALRLEFHRAVKNSSGSLQLSPCQMPAPVSKGKFFNIQIIADRASQNEETMAIYCDEREFTTLEHGDNLYQAVAAHVLKMRKSGQCYPIYITDIDVPPSMLGAEGRSSAQTVLHLKFKRHVEERLNASLYALVESFQAKAS